MTTSRRKFIRNSLIAAGAVAIGGAGLVRLGRSSRQALYERRDVVAGDLVAGDLRAPEEPGARPRPLDAEAWSPATEMAPRYLELERTGELAKREAALWKIFERCRLCPRHCGAPRAAGRAGMCGAADTFKVASIGAHFGEERPLVGQNGSGTIFFSNCNTLCIFCQNWEINHRGDGRESSHAKLAEKMLQLQARGCHNINLVTPTHLVPHIVSALRIAIKDGLNIPFVYNSSGFDSLEVIKLLDGVIDIYLPDFKYQDAKIAARFSNGAPDYPKHAAAAIKEMHRQVGDLQMVNGIAYRGLIIRHLILPDNLAGTDEFVKWVARELGPNTHVNIMAQFRPAFQSYRYPPLDRRPTQKEIDQAMRWARNAGLRNLQ